MRLHITKRGARIFRIIALFLIILFVGICFFLKYIGYRTSPPAEYLQTLPQTLQKVVGYADFASITSDGPVIPGLSEGTVPQGLCYVEKYDVFLSTGYHKGGAPSTIFVIENESGKLVKSVILYDTEGKPFCGHVGGIASDGEWIWISSENCIYTIPYETLWNVKNMDSVVLSDRFDCEIKADYAYWDGIHLWIGEYSNAPYYKTDSSHHLTSSAGEEFNALVFGHSVSSSDGSIEKADVALAVPDKVQGIVIHSNGSIILSRSFWCFEDSNLMCYSLPDNNSSIYITVEGEQIPVFFLEEQYLQWKLDMPPMSEGIALANSNYYILFESAALLYSWYSNNPLTNIMIVPSR